MMNAASPIGQLPNETLAEIFELLPEPIFRPSDLTEYASSHVWDPRNVVPVTAVCHRWREIALSTYSLWSTIRDVNSKAWHDEYWERSAGCPTRVVFDSQVSQSTLDIIEDQPDRVQELHIGFPSGSSHSILDVPLRNLEHCTLSRILPETIFPRAALFSRQTHCLRTLILHHLTFLPPPQFPSLSHLIIFNRTKGDLLYSLEDLLDLLSGSPRLQELHIAGLVTSGLKTTPSSPERAGPIHLAQLAKLSLREYYRDHTSRLAEGLLQHLIIPRTCIIRLSPIGPNAFAQPLTHLGRIERATHLCINSSAESTRFNIALIPSSIEVIDVEHGQFAHVDISASSGEGLGALLRRLCAVSQTWPLFANVRELYLTLHTVTATDLAAFGGIFPALPELQVLVISRWVGFSASGTSGLLRLLQPQAVQSCAGGDADGVRRVVHCPRLALITLDCVDDDAAFVLGLARARAAEGHPLSELRLGHWRRIPTRRAFDYVVHVYAGPDGVEFVRVCDEADAYAMRADAMAERVAPAASPNWMQGLMTQAHDLWW